MDEEIYEIYEKVKDKLSEEEFLNKMEILKEEYNDVSFMGDIDIANMIVGNYVKKENEPISNESATDKISKLESGLQKISIIGRVMGIGNPKTFTSRKGKEGKLCNLQIADDTGNLRVIFWSENIKLLKEIHEGDVIKINNVDIKDGYRGALEGHLQLRSTINKLNPDDYSVFPKYEETITPIKDINPDTKVNIIARITRLQKIRSFEKNGKEGQVTSISLQDETGKIDYTLWNKDVNLIESLDLNEGDAVKILSAQARERNGEISLSHWDGRIVKGDFDVPEVKGPEDNIIKIGEAHEEKDVTIFGIVTKVRDTITFTRANGSNGFVKSVEVMDDTGSIRVTLWGDDTKLDINKGDIIKVIGGNIEFDEYASSGYQFNTNWNTRFIINPDENSEFIETLMSYKSQMGPIRIEEVQEINDDGEEVDIIGRVISINDINEFQREDGTTGVVKSVNFADETGTVRVSFWDEKANENFKIAEAFYLENARTKMGMYAVDLNIGKTSRVRLLNDEEAAILPSFETLEQMIYTSKQIVDLDEDDYNIRVVGRIIENNEPHEFERENGTGLVRNIEIADNTGSIRVTLWDDNANIIMEVGDPIKLENPRISFREDHLEISVGNNTSILPPSEKELENLPSYEELQEIIYKVKTIESLEAEDTNVRIKGVFNDATGNKVLINKCPHCNNTIEQQVEDEFVCDFCGEEIDIPKHLLMIPGRLEDETGEISITFFNKLAEELLEMKLEEIVSIIDESGDLGALEGKVDDLNGLTIEVIADVKFDEYNEEIRLSPKKILSKTY